MDPRLVHPELRPAVRRLPAVPVQSALVRSLATFATAMLPTKTTPGVDVHVIAHGEVRLRVYQPTRKRTDAAMIWMHGGGLILGTAKVDDRFCRETALEVGMTIVSVDYRLAPKHPFPTPLNDCYAAWQWTRKHAAKLAIDPNQIVIGGQSAGGGLAAALTQRLHDEGHTPIAQLLLCPMLDDRTAVRTDVSDRQHLVWNKKMNHFAWTSYLGHEPGGTTVPEYAVPARRHDLTGLPPTWTYVSDIELFHDEAVGYSRRLAAAGTQVALEVVPGGFHGFEGIAPDTTIARALLQNARTWLAASTKAR